MFRGPPRRSFKMVIHVPASTLSIEHGLFKKTYIAGLIARAASIFRVDTISIYRDPDASLRDLKIFREVLRYIATPPYLRKKLIPKSRYLKAVGVLPPLATPNHPVEDDIAQDHVREGVVVEVPRRGRVCIDAGLDKIYCIDSKSFGKATLDIGDIVLVRVKNNRVLSIVSRDSIRDRYWIYRVSVSRSLRRSIEMFGGPLVISSRRGGSLKDVKDKLLSFIERDLKTLSIVFGSPDRDPDEIAVEEGWDIYSYRNVVLNSAPNQGVRSIRTFEAVYITLALVNTFIYDSKGI